MSGRRYLDDSRAPGTAQGRLAPTALLARAYRRALQRQGELLLDYGDPAGDVRLREAVAHMLRAVRGMPITGEDVLITRGSQMALWLLAAVLFEPGDRIGVEAFGYPPAFQAFRERGARCVPLPVDDDGVRVDALERALSEGPLRALYLTPHHQYPTLATLSEPRRQRIRALAREHRFAIIEDDYDHEYHYEGRPVLPMAARDARGHVVYVGTLSKVLAPGLRTGYIVARPDLLTHCAALRVQIDRQGDLPTERALAELLEDGELQRQIRRTRRIYRERRDVLIDLLHERFDGVLDFESPRGGMALWCDVARGVDVDRWVERCAERDVHFMPGRRARFDGRGTSKVRIGFARCTPAELDRATHVMRRRLRGC